MNGIDIEGLLCWVRREIVDHFLLVAGRNFNWIEIEIHLDDSVVFVGGVLEKHRVHYVVGGEETREIRLPYFTTNDDGTIRRSRLLE
jgi:hypothetical protein